MRNQALLILAGALLCVLGAMHSYLGERLIIRRILALPDLPRLRGGRLHTERVLRYAWHLTSLAWWGFAAAVLVLAFSAPGPAALGAVLGATFVLSGAVILVTVGAWHPAWPLFLLAGAATWYATL